MKRSTVDSAFRIATSGNTVVDSRVALEQALAELDDAFGTPPDFVLVAASALHDLTTVASGLEKAAAKRVHGLSSCRGGLT